MLFAPDFVSFAVHIFRFPGIQLRDLAEQISGQYELEGANIVPDAIIMLSKNIPAFLKPNGTYIVSGIIDTREQEVLQALSACGFTVRERREHGGWLCFVCGKG